MKRKPLLIDLNDLEDGKIMTHDQKTAWKNVVESLRLLFLQKNSHIPDIQEWIDEQVVETINIIRDTPKSIKTAQNLDIPQDPDTQMTISEDDFMRLLTL